MKSVYSKKILKIVLTKIWLANSKMQMHQTNGVMVIKDVWKNVSHLKLVLINMKVLGISQSGTSEFQQKTKMENSKQVNQYGLSKFQLQMLQIVQQVHSLAQAQLITSLMDISDYQVVMLVIIHYQLQLSDHVPIPMMVQLHYQFQAIQVGQNMTAHTMQTQEQFKMIIGVYSL